MQKSALRRHRFIPQAAGVLSPGGKVAVLFSIGPEGEPMWSLKYKNKPVIEPSRLGFELAAFSPETPSGDGLNLKDGFEILGAKTGSKDETWEPVWGETREIRNFYNELEVTLTKGLIIRFRVYDYGVGLRYEIGRAHV